VDSDLEKGNHKSLNWTGGGGTRMLKLGIGFEEWVQVER
jgi:hypothetical protein